MHHDLHRVRPDRAFTLLELLLVMAVFVILAALFLPAIEKSRQRAKQVACSSNLRQIGLAFHGFAHDHQSLFPMQASTNVGGTLEFIKAGHSLTGQFHFAYRHLQALSNDLGDPKLLVCPTDKRAPAANFAGMRNEHVSYFINTGAEYARPDSLLAGDRNVEAVQGEAGPVLRPGTGTFIRWTEELHIHRGNVLFADARVEGLTSMALNDKLRTAAGGGATGGNALWLPVGSTAWAPASPSGDGSKVLVNPSRSTKTLDKAFEDLSRFQNRPAPLNGRGAGGAAGFAENAPPADNPVELAKAAPAGEVPLPPGVAQDDIAVMRQELGQTNLAQVLAEMKVKGRAGLLTALLWFLLLLALMTLLEIWRRRRVARRLRAPGGR